MMEQSCGGRILRSRFELGAAPERLDRFLAEAHPDLSRSQIKKLIEDGRVTLEGAAVKASHRLRGGELLLIDLPEPAPTELLPQSIPLKILFEDSDLVVIDKPAGLVVHPAAGHADGTLVNALLHHCEDLSGIGGELRPGIVHRLDKGTSGVLVVTKNDATHRSLSDQFRIHSITRRYIALVFGLPDGQRGRIESELGRHPGDRKRMASVTRGGRRAVTHWRVLRRYEQDGLSLLELSLETGRTHQIRVHLSENRLPIAGDPVYTNPARPRQLRDETLRGFITGLHRQALHARLLGFTHPGRQCRMEFASPPAEDLARLLAWLDHKYGYEASAVPGPPPRKEVSS